MTTAQQYSANWWREWFAARGGVASVAEVEQVLGGVPLFDPKNLSGPDYPNRFGINGAARNIFFAGSIVPALVSEIQAGGPVSKVLLRGPNGESASDLATVYRRKEDDQYNPGADRPEGWQLISAGLSSVEPVHSPLPSGGFGVTGYTGGYSIVVKPIPVVPNVTPSYLFRGTGMIDMRQASSQDVGGVGAPVNTPTGTLAGNCAALVQPYADRIAAVDRAYPNLADDDFLDGNNLATKIGAIYGIMVEANEDPEVVRQRCPTPYPEAVGFSRNPQQNVGPLAPPVRPGRGKQPVAPPDGNPNLPPVVKPSDPVPGNTTLPGTTPVGSSNLGPLTEGPPPRPVSDFFPTGTGLPDTAPTPVLPATPVAAVPAGVSPAMLVALGALLLVLVGNRKA